VVAAYGDGTIRWHRMDDGRELLALQVLSDKKNWVAWTPEGFYGATPGAFGVLKWHVNRGNNAAARCIRKGWGCKPRRFHLDDPIDALCGHPRHGFDRWPTASGRVTWV
jgi:hypothetical protein